MDWIVLLKEKNKTTDGVHIRVFFCDRDFIKNGFNKETYLFPYHIVDHRKNP